MNSASSSTIGTSHGMSKLKKSKPGITIHEGPAFKASVEQNGNTGEHLAEKDILLSLNNDIASVRDKRDILKKIHPKLKQLFATDDIFICILDNVNSTLNPFLRVGGERRMKHAEYESVINAKFRIYDGFIDSILGARGPVVFDVEEVSRWPNAPGYMKISYDAGLAQTLSRSLYHGEDPIGIFTLWSESKNGFSTHHIDLIDQVADQISVIVTNILDNEAIRQREKENEILLVISNEIAAIRSREDLTRILSTSLKAHIRFDDAAITFYNKTRNVYNLYAYHIEKKRLDHPDLQRALVADYPLKDNDLSNPHTPMVIDVEAFAKSDHSAVAFVKRAGIKEIASIKLVDGDNLIGVFVLLSEQKNVFTKSSLHIMQRISYQISIAVAKLHANEEVRDREREKEILLTISNELGSIREKEDLLPLLKKQLESLSFYNDITIARVDKNKKTFSAFLINEQSDRLEHKDYPQMRDAHHQFPDGVFEVALQSRKPVLFDIEEIIKRPDAPSYIRFLFRSGTVEMAGISLRNRNVEIGVLFCFSKRREPFTERQLTLVQGIGNQLGTVVANILANEEIKERAYEKTILLSLSNEMAAVRTHDDLFKVVNTKLKELFSVQGFGIGLVSEDGKTHNTFLVGFEEKARAHLDFSSVAGQKYAIDDGVFDKVISSENPIVFDINEIRRQPRPPAYVEFWQKLNIHTIIGMALRVGETTLGCLFFHLDPKSFFNLRRNLLKGVCSQISIAISNILANEKIERQLSEIRSYKERLEKERQYLQGEVSSGYTFDDIIGASAEMQKLFRMLSQVSFSSSTVLLLGETGTGKELIARAIHNSSNRKDSLMVKVNCASIPANLIESELFGHEKGAFTGATERRIGKFELANKGTLFLDEIGEIPLSLQAKLLRALQEKEIERVGGTNVIRLDVRIIAATNRNLEKEVREERFRSDLYYRLNVFPITIPPLRDRKDDIPLLATYFVRKFSKNSGKMIHDISSRALKNLQAYSWPGNVRELEHLIERSVLLTKGSIIKDIHLPAGGNQQIKTSIDSRHLKSYEENERDHILFILEKCKGKIFGRGGAAEILGLNVSTLNSKIKKLGIKKANPFDNTGDAK